MIVAVPRESHPGERRVALIPASVPPLVKAGMEVLVEAGAGESAGYPDQQYVEKGAKIAPSRNDVFAADILLQVRAAGANPQAGRADLELYRQGQVVIGMCDPLGSPQLAAEMAAKGVSLFALELLPRITRAQSMDVLSSQATIAGYRAVLLAAEALPKMFPMMITAAGTLNAAKVFVIGAGVAGLQAIATARRLGAAVSAYDVRPAVKEQVQSLGAKFVEMQLETGAAEGQGRLRPANGRRVLPQAARVDGPRGGRERRGDHHGGRARQEVADPGDRRDGRQDGPRLGDRRSGGRAGRQLRADQGRTRRSSRTA